MADRDLIAFVRARLDYEDLNHYVFDKQVGEQNVRDSIRLIVDEFERVSEYCAESSEEVHHGQKMGLEHAVVSLAGIWRTHPDWRAGWWTAGE